MENCSETTEVTGRPSIIPAIEYASFYLIVSISPSSAVTMESLGKWNQKYAVDGSHPGEPMLVLGRTFAT